MAKKRGPKPKRLRLLQLSPTSDVGECSKPPGWLSDAARSHWRQLSPQLDRLGILHALDFDLLAIFCTMLAEFVRIQTQINELDTPTLTQPSGRKDLDPLLKMEDACFNRLVRLAVEFGLTPASRKKLGIARRRTKAPNNDRRDRFFRDTNRNTNESA